MSPQAWLSIAVTLSVFAVLMWQRDAPSDLLFLLGLVVVTAGRVITPTEALGGFANPAVITIGALFVVAAGLRSTGVLDWLGNSLLGRARTAFSALARMSGALIGLSAFINNTPVVAMFVPVVLDWCRKRGVSPAKLMIPLSYLTILGGTCTLVGTSTNIVTNGLLRDEYRVVKEQDRYSEAFRYQLREMTLFEIGRVGLPCALIGAAYLLFVGRRLLPERSDLIERLDDERREYLVEILVQPECRLVGKTIEEAGLRHLRGLFLIEIDRDDEVITPVTPTDVIRAGDRLVFTGIVTTIVDLVKIPGLVPATDRAYKLRSQRRDRHLSEAVISKASPLVGQTVRGANFRRRYNAAVVAVHRGGQRLTSKVGDVVLEPGDTLLLQTRTNFADQFRNSRDFYLVASVEGSQPRRHDRAWLAVGLLAVFVLWINALSWIGPDSPFAGLNSPAIAAATVAALMIWTRCLQPAEARAVIDLQVLVTIAAAVGLGRALTESGAAEGIAQMLVRGIGQHPYLLLIVLYLLASYFTEMITNSAVAAMLFPLAVATAAASGYSPRPFIMAITLAASMSFLTPIGYQTNLMVMGPGGYKPRDYLRAGLPLSLLMAVVALILVPRVWPFAL
ncbi:MAG: SLC13 family permease [Planctomycetota bacterium]